MQEYMILMLDQYTPERSFSVLLDFGYVVGFSVCDITGHDNNQIVPAPPYRVVAVWSDLATIEVLMSHPTYADLIISEQPEVL